MISLLLALAIDALWAEPPDRLHPVIWMGSYLKWMKKRNQAGRWRAFWQGSAYLGLGILLFWAFSFLLLLCLSYLPNYLSAVALAILLKPMFSIRALLSAGEAVKQALETNDILKARHLLSWHLVSRDSSELDNSEIAAATVSSLAENLTDSIVAPLFYFIFFGLGGAVIYRFINTADAMLGYRNEELEYFGKAAARLDDLLNFIPARLSSVLLWFLLLLLGKDAAKGLCVARQARLPSLNAAWTMGMVAGGLNIRLEKRGIYCLNPEGCKANEQSISKAQQLILLTTALITLLCWGRFYA